MTSDAVIETERLTLRRMTAADAEPFCALMGDPEVAQFLTTDGKPQPYPTAWRSFASMLGHWEIRGYGMFSVIEKATGDWIGRIGPWRPAGWPSLECGWSVAKAHWGKGYAPEAAIASIRWMFAEFPDLPRVISLIDPKNANSQAVAGKVGEVETDEEFLFDGTVRLKIWAAERHSWLERFGD
ncbi:MAG: GNAT family N-acetyltransferase [Pseudomonadota bacterium]